MQQQSEKATSENTSGSGTTLSPQEMENERKRHDLRLALARRMKIDLIRSEEEKQFEKFAFFDQKIKEAEKLRTDNQEREKTLTSQIRRQQQGR